MLAFCRINITFLQNNYIEQLLTIGHDYPVPVDKHNRDKKITAPSPSPVGSKVKYVNFAIPQSVVNIFLLKFRMQTELQYIRNISNAILI